jgi:hypothetical protein
MIVGYGEGRYVNDSERIIVRDEMERQKLVRNRTYSRDIL